MTRNALWFVAVTVVGALLGSVLGKLVALVVPAGPVRDLFATELSAGLAPATLKLRIIDLTFGCMLNFSLTAVLGIIAAALLFRGLSR